MLRAGVGDVHLSGYQSDILSKSGLAQRLDIINMSLRQMADYCRKNGIKHLEIWGDLINDKQIIYNVAQNVFKDILTDYNDLTFYLISGNHDLSSTGELQTSALSVFSNYSNVRVINDVLVEDNITYLAFSNHMADDLKKLKANDILVSHFGISEAVLQSGLSITTNIKLTDLKKFKLILLGHYHKPQELSNQYSRLWYSGNVCHTSWSDKNESKRFLVYDTDTLEVTAIPFVGFPEYREYTINSKEDASDILVEAEKAKNFGHHVRVRKMFDGDISAPADIVLIEKQKDVDITNRGIDLTQTKDVQLKNYMSIKEVPEAEQEKYISVLRDFKII